MKKLEIKPCIICGRNRISIRKHCIGIIKEKKGEKEINKYTLQCTSMGCSYRIGFFYEEEKAIQQHNKLYISNAFYDECLFFIQNN